MTQRVGAARTTALTQFQGDGVLATFNVPVEDPNHASNAFQAREEILACVACRDYAGERVRVRIGLNTGPLVAGNVGGGGRRSYTVHGDTVTLAARLEALCKEHGTSLLVSADTAEALRGAKLVAVGKIGVRGITEPVAVYAIPPVIATR